MDNAVQSTVTLKVSKCRARPPPMLSKASEVVLGAAGAECSAKAAYCTVLLRGHVPYFEN